MIVCDRQFSYALRLTFGGFGKSRMFITATSSLYAIETARVGAQWP